VYCKTVLVAFASLLVGAIGLSGMSQAQQPAGDWVIDSQQDWKQNSAASENLDFKDGMASPNQKTATFKSTLKKFAQKRSPESIVFNQSPIWQNWNQTKTNIGPANLGDAPVTLAIGPKNYWMFGIYNRRRDETPFSGVDAKLDGFEIPLKTTRYANQFDAPGGLKPSAGGYHAWQSKDMVNWVHHGSVTEKFSRWVTTAEYFNGKTYLYYDYPNDQDPHVYVDDDLTDGVVGDNKGMAFNDPSDGSDCAFIRDLKGDFHVIYENWDPIDASQRSWDSPLAGHAVSKDGIKGFKILKPAVDNRTTPTGKKITYKHPHWESHPDWDSADATYEVHQPEQEAYGDWASICIGGQYYLFGDYEPSHGHKMSVGWFTSSSLDKQFTWCDNIGSGHPDPDVCFAEGQFYLVTQQQNDFTSPGPWVETVETRVGVDTDNDGAVDKWSHWQAVKESYAYIEGFSKQIKKTPAAMDLSGLPEGFGFQFEVKITDSTENKSKPILDNVSVSLK